MEPLGRVANARGSAATEIVFSFIIMKSNRYKTFLNEANHFIMSQIHPKTLKLINNWITKHKIVIFVFLKHFQANSVHKHSISQFYIVPK